MDHAGLSIFPWDFADEGLDEVLGFVRDLGKRTYEAQITSARVEFPIKNRKHPLERFGA